jgi:chromosomal replication initiation ATPase DnaA
MKLNIFNDYTKQCADLFGISEELLFTKSKRRDVVDSRYLLYYMCSIRPMKVVYIQEYMFSRGYIINHSNIIYGINQVKKKMTEDADYRTVIKSMDTSCATV